MFNKPLKVLEFAVTESKSPDEYLRWKILYGNIDHVTGAVSTLQVRRKDRKVLGVIKVVAAATSSGDVSLGVVEDIILDSSMELRFSHGGVPNSTLKVVVLEWNPEEDERVESKKKGFWRFLP